jgi:exonuclease III
MKKRVPVPQHQPAASPTYSRVLSPVSVSSQSMCQSKSKSEVREVSVQPEALRSDGSPATATINYAALLAHVAAASVVAPRFHNLVELLKFSERESFVPFGRSSGSCVITTFDAVNRKRETRCVRKYWPQWKLQELFARLPTKTRLHLQLVLQHPVSGEESDMSVVGDVVEGPMLFLGASAYVPLPVPWARVLKLRVGKQPAPPPLVSPERPRSRIERAVRAHARIRGCVKFQLDGKRRIGVIQSVSGFACEVLYWLPREGGAGKRKLVRFPDQRVSNVWFIPPEITAPKRPRVFSGPRPSEQVAIAHESVTGVANCEQKNVQGKKDAAHSTVENTSDVKNDVKKSGVRVCAFNVRTAQPRAQSRELLHFLDERKLDVLVISECRWTEVPFYFNTYKCALNPSVEGHGGVAIVSKHALIDVRLHDTGCLTCKVNCGKFHLRIFALYCPQSGRPTDELDKFWQRLSAFASDIADADHAAGPTRRIFLGDFNAGDKIAKQKHHHTADLRAEFMQLHDLRSSYERLPVEARKVAYTWTSPNGKFMRQLDGVLVQQRYFSDVSHVRIVDPPIPSDHRPVIVDFKFHCKKPPKKAIVERPDYSKLRQDPEKKRLCLELLKPLLESDSTTYSQLAAGVREASMAFLVPDAPPPSPDLSTPNDTVVTEVRKTGHLKDLMKAQHVADVQHCTRVVAEFKALFEKQPKKAYETLKQLTAKSPKVWPSKSKPEDVIAHFKTINGLPREHTHPGFSVRKNMRTKDLVSDHPFDAGEVRYCQKQLKRHKAEGPDGVVAEFLELEEFTPILTRLANEYLDGTSIDECLQTLICCVPKKGDLSFVVNFRPVCLISHFLKLVNLLLLHRIRTSVDPYLRSGQNGFRQNRGTMSHAMAVKLLIETGNPMFLLFVDFSSAFPSITFASIESALRAFRVPQKIIDAVMRCHKGHVVRVKGPDGLPIDGSYELLTGVMQGDTLAPYIFIIVLDCLLDEMTHLQPFWLGGAEARSAYSASRLRNRGQTPTVNEFGYADDLLFPCANFEDMAPLLAELQQKAKSVGLDINLKKGKTEYLIVNHDDDAEFPELRATDSDGNSVVVNRTYDYVYLGTNVADIGAQLMRRLGAAWVCLRKFRPFWDSKCDFNVKAQLFLCMVQSALTYGMELLPPDLAAYLDRRYTQMLKYVFYRGQTDVDTWQIYANGRFPHLSSLLILRRIKLVGHVMRRDEPLSRILKTNSIMQFGKHGADGRQATLTKELSRDLTSFEIGDDQEYKIELAAPWRKWPSSACTDQARRDWRALAKRRAELHEDKIYKALTTARVQRYRIKCVDEDILDGKCDRAVLAALIKSALMLDVASPTDVALTRAPCPHYLPAKHSYQVLCPQCLDDSIAPLFQPRRNQFRDKFPIRTRANAAAGHLHLREIVYEELI